MKRVHISVLSLSLTFVAALAACAGGPRAGELDPGSRAGMPPTEARLASAFARICDHPNPCDATSTLGAEDRASCLEFAKAAADAPCAAEVSASYACSEPHIACAEDGRIDEQATDPAVRQACPEALAAHEACCATAPGSLLCGVESDDDWSGEGEGDGG